jgi:hypothetical protein
MTLILNKTVFFITVTKELRLVVEIIRLYYEIHRNNFVEKTQSFCCKRLWHINHLAKTVHYMVCTI